MKILDVVAVDTQSFEHTENVPPERVTVLYLRLEQSLFRFSPRDPPLGNLVRVPHEHLHDTLIL